MYRYLYLTYNEQSSLVSEEVFWSEPEEPEHHVQPEEGQQEDLQQSVYLQKHNSHYNK